MASPLGDRNRADFEIPLVAPAMDASRWRTRLPDGVLEEAIGVDGRFIGAIRNFPGFSRVTQLTVSGVAISSVTFIAVVDVPGTDQATYTRYRGYVVRHGATVTYFRYTAGAWTSRQIATGISTTAPIGVTTAGKWIIVTMEDRTGWFFAGDATLAADIRTFSGANRTAPTAPTAAAGSDAANGGYLEFGDYQFAYRYRDDTNGYNFALSGLLTRRVTDANTTTTLLGIEKPVGEATATGATHLQLFRTIAATVANTVFDGGVFYLEKTVTVAQWDAAAQTMGSRPDIELVQLTQFDPVADANGAAPTTAPVVAHQGIVMMEGDHGESIRWSNIRKFEPDNFPGTNEYYLPEGAGRLMALSEAEDNIYGLCDSSIMLIQIVGGRILGRRIYSSLGLSSRYAHAKVGPDLVFMSQAGLMTLSGNTGQVFRVAEADRIVQYFGWNTATDIWAASDAVLGATFVLHGDYPGPTAEEKTDDGCLVIWHGSKLMTMLSGMGDFVACASGPDVENGGAERAHFITADGIVVMPNTNTASGTPTLLGVAGTINGTTTSGGTTNLVDSEAAFDDTAVGARVYLINSSNDFTAYAVAAKNSGTSLQLTDLAGNAVTVPTATKYTISPVYMRLTPRALGGDFGRVVLSSIGVCCPWSSANATNGKFRLSTITGASDRLPFVDLGSDGDVKKLAAMSDLPEDTMSNVNIAGPRVTVQCEALCAGARFEITGLRLTGRLTPSSKTKAST